MNTGIYQIKNLVNGKVYVGSAKSFTNRFIAHKKLLKRGKHHSIKLQNAWEKYGADNFLFQKLIICEFKDLIMYEQRAIDGLNAVKNGYNVNPTAGSSAGRPTSDATRAKMSASFKGRKRDPEAVAKTAAAHTGMKRSDESREKMSLSQKQRWDNATPEELEEMRAQVSAVHKGKKLTPEHIEKVSTFNKNREITDAEKAIKSRATKGMWDALTQEQRDARNANMTAAIREKAKTTPSKHIGMKRSEESRKRMSDAQKASASRRKAAKSAPQQESA